MLRTTLNLGILAHVDAGKTTLTERLLYEAGVIDQVGSVDAGTTHTDSLDLERQRGITIRAAVVSFPVDDIAVNVIDTPGHPDFIAEVERALGVLDGAVLVISAVEGVQPQTRVLMRALQRLRVPTLLFINKIDRRGADTERVLAQVTRRLTTAAVPTGTVAHAGTPQARFTRDDLRDPGHRSRLIEVLADHDDELLATYVNDESALTGNRLRDALRAQTARARVHPVFAGSAVTGAGVPELTAGLTGLLPAADGDNAGPPSGQVFTIERGAAGEKVAYVRMFTGTVRPRDRLPLPHGAEAKVTAVHVFDRGAWVRRDQVGAGQIGKLWTSGPVQVGATVGAARATGPRHTFPPPTMETTVVPRHPADGGALRAALAQLAEQDPLINVRVDDDTGGEVSVSLYGEVQKQVLQATLAGDYHLDIECRETTTICVERPVGAGEAVEILYRGSNPFRATIGLRVAPAPPGSGIGFRLGVDYRVVPMYIYKSLDRFAEAMQQHVRQTLREGRYGWQVTDCTVTLVECNYSSPDGPPATFGPLSTAADYRKLTPMVLMQALQRAGTVVCEPVMRLDLEVPAATLGAVQTAVGRLAGALQGQSPRGDLAALEILLPAARLSELQRQLPGLTSGEGVLESRFDGYRPVSGDPPVRPRRTTDPLDREAYLRSLSREGARG